MCFLSGFLLLVFLHYLAEYVFMPVWLDGAQSWSGYALFVDAFLWAGTISAGLAYMHFFWLWKFGLLLAVRLVLNWAEKRSEWISLHWHVGEVILLALLFAVLYW